jgi:lysophospholipase L1-like esterase
MLLFCLDFFNVQGSVQVSIVRVVVVVFSVLFGSYGSSVELDVRTLSLFVIAIGAAGLMTSLMPHLVPVRPRPAPARELVPPSSSPRLRIRAVDEHPRPVPVPVDRPLRYVAIGDSSVEGLNDPDGHGGNRGWADRIAERLAAQHGEVLYANLAVRGRTTRQVRDQQLARAVAMKPDIAAVVTGTNDVLRGNFDADALEEELYLMQRALIDAGARVVTLTVPDLTPVMPLARILRKRVHALDAAIRRACERSGASVCDLAMFPVSSDPRLLSPDRLHANSAGHARIADGVAYCLGLPGSSMQWSAPFAEALHPTFGAMVRAELAWANQYLLPWIWRHLRRRSSGDGIVAKRPKLTRVSRDEATSEYRRAVAFDPARVKATVRRRRTPLRAAIHLQ